MSVSRRRFLGFSGLVVVAMATPPLVLKRASAGGVADFLRLRMRPLAIPDEVLTAFVDDFRDHIRGTHWEAKFRMTGWNQMRMNLFDDDGGLTGDPGMVHPVEKIVTHFVMSTNVLLNGAVAEGKKPVKYLWFWTNDDGCGNPFADFDFR